MPPYPYPNDDYDDDDDDEEEDFQDDDDDDDDDEGEFVPGMDDDDEELEEEEEVLPHVHGTLKVDTDGSLVYSSDNGMIDLKSLEPLTKEQNPWEVNKADDTSMSSLIALEMIGKFELEASDKKYVQRRIRVTLTSTTTTANGAASNGKSFKSTGESDEEDGKKPAASSSDKQTTVLYAVHGLEVANGASLQLLEFRGTCVVPQNSSDSVELVCDVRWTSAKQVPHVSTAAAAVARKRGADDDDDEDDEADDQVDYEELIALHEEAGLPVDQLRKRLAEQQDGGDGAPDKKKGKPADDEDDDYGF